MIRHHPDDAWLMAFAADRLTRGQTVVTDSHVERCPHCQARMRDFEALGGAMLEAIEPVLLAPEALARTLARIDGAPAAAPRRAAPLVMGTHVAPAPVAAHGAPPQAEATDNAAAGAKARAAPPMAETPAASTPARRQPARPIPAGLRAELPAGAVWPRSLRDATTTRWRWLGPGMRWCRVTLADDRAANVFLLRIAAGKSLPAHTHDGCELTQVIYGAFDDGRERFEAGDFDEADGSVHHQPVVEAGSECICLASVEGRVAFDGRIARVLGALVGM